MILVSSLYWDPDPQAFRLPLVDWPVFWYGLLFAFGFACGFPILVGVLNRFWGGKEKKKAVSITDQLVIYMILGTVLGARIGHFLFYEKPSFYLNRPLDLLRIWEGGLSSHGAAVGIIISLVLFSKKIRSKQPELTPIRLLDFVCIPAAFAGGCIRVGNFINQEILGTVTTLPWGVIFGHPADRSFPAPRHPVQIYEALFYFSLFFLLWKLSFSKNILSSQGKMIGFFLMAVFCFRFLIEFFKTEQSRIFDSSFLTMGQILSLPLIFAGIVLYRKTS